MAVLQIDAETTNFKSYNVGMAVFQIGVETKKFRILDIRRPKPHKEDLMDTCPDNN